MIECIFTIDYEIYGNGQGLLRDQVYEPARKLKEVFDHVRGGDRGFVIADRQRPRLGDHVHPGEVAQDPSLDLLRSRLERAAPLQCLIRKRNCLRILEQTPCAGFPVKCFDGQPLQSDQ